MENRKEKIGLVIMASGLGTRYGNANTNKLLEELGGKPLIKWIIDSTENLFDKRVVVTRSRDVKALCDGLKLECIMHDFPNRNDTVRLGLSAVKEEIDYCFFVPGDQPLISTNTVVRLINEAKEHKTDIIRPGFCEMVGSPIGFSKRFFEELLMLPEKKGGNYIAMNNQELVRTVTVTDEYELWDVDTTKDLEKIKRIVELRY